MSIGALVFFSAAFVAAEGDNSFLVRNVTVHPVSGTEIANASVLVRDGLIAEIGLKVAAPKAVRVIEGKGLHLYPGMIDSGTQLGLTEITSVRETDDTGEIGTYNPQLRAEVAVNPASEHIPVTRANGITAAITFPDGGILSGQAALIHLDGWTWEEMDVRRSAAMILRFPLLQSGGGRFGGGGAPGARTRSFSEATRDYERQVAGLRDFFDQARRYQRAKAAAAPGFRTDLKFEAMLPVLDRKLPVMVTAIRRRAIRDAIDFADREKVRIILAESREVAPFAAELKSKDIPVILGPTLALPLERDDPYDAAFTLPAELHKAGVKFAFGSFGNQFARNLPYQAAASVAFGLPYAEALKAVTLNPAEIWGVAEKLGSIDKGKWADLVLTDSDILETRTQVKQVFIQGRHVDLDNKHHRLYQKYLNRP